MKNYSENVRNDPLTNEEIERWHADDLQAARIVVGLIAGVFAIGLLLYAFIFWIVL